MRINQKVRVVDYQPNPLMNGLVGRIVDLSVVRRLNFIGVQLDDRPADYGYPHWIFTPDEIEVLSDAS